jgi:hypothetical protein
VTTVTGTRSGAHPFGGDHAHDIGVSHLTIKTTASMVDGTKLLQCARVLIDDVTADGMYIGLALYGCTDSVIRNSYAQNISGGGFGFCVGEADTVGYTGRSANVVVQDCVAVNGGGTGFRVRGTMDSVASPYKLRSDAPVRNLGTKFLRCTATKMTSYGFRVTNAGSLRLDHCACDGSAKDAYLNYALQGVIDSEMVECTLRGTLITAAASVKSPWPSWWSADGGWGSCSNDFITSGGVRAKVK